MINRTIIRLKIVQLMYAYYQNGDKNIDTAEKELLFSLSKAYDLYNYMLLLIVSVSRYAMEQVEHQEQLNKVGHIDTPVSHRFIDNKFAIQLEANKQLQEYADAKKKTWDNEFAYVKNLYDDIVASEYYKEYMAMETVTYEDDQELWRKLYKNVIMKDERIDDILEDQSLYWNDDREVVDTFVLKTIKRFAPENGASQELVPEYKDIEDREFATRLFRRTILNDEYYRSVISRCIKNWEFNRLAYMDVIIMQIAVAELLSFPQVPISVTINEYVEVAKWYSTPKSASYVNGIIDAVAKMLKKEGKLMKN
ncbi:MAG: transcription antitermination factor NusB [Prevotellaceae bacterium]|nr:transcription antitermination factor NusB [Candidatus Minthosoma caballi]